MQVEAIQNIDNKRDKLLEIIERRQLNKDEVIFVGNDVNDIDAMTLCDISFCPSDSHELVKKTARIVLDAKGGNEIMREIIEKHFSVNIYELLEK